MKERVSRALFALCSIVLFWHARAYYRGRLLYDDLMIRFWPYDHYPGEWKDLFSGTKKER